MTTPHTEMHFGPSWMQNSSRAKSFQKQAAPAPSDDAAANGGGPHPSAALSYSSVIREQAALANGAHPAADAQPGFADAAHPFRYSKEAMLALWHDNKARELPIEFERWEVIFRPDGGMPAGLKDMDEVEKRAFGLSFNPDRRPTASTANSSASLATLGDLKLDPPARRRQVTGSGAEALNSPVRERFGGIQGGVLGGLGMGAKEPFAGAAGAVKGAPRRKEETSAPLPPSSTNSWRPTRALSSNLPELTTPGTETVTADGRRWRTGTEEPAVAAPGPDRAAASAGFNANAARAGGWRERERMKKAEGELSSNAGWTSVDKADTKKGRSGTAAADDKAGDTFSNAYAALDQDDEADAPAQAEAAPAAPQPSQEQLEKDALKLVNWTYKDPAGNVQGPFPAQNMHDWNAQGYFAPSLLVKRESDAAYETVATLTLLSPDPNEIFFQRPAVKAPAPPGLMPTAAQMLGLGAVSTPLVSPLVGFADPALAERNPVDHFMQQGESPAARWGGLGTPTRQHAQPFANGIAQQSPYQQHSQPVFDPAGQLYGQRTPARHPFQDPTPFGMAPNQSPYASPLPQHHAVAPWNQPQAPQPTQPFFGMGGPQYGAAPANNGGFGYPGMSNVGLSGGEPWAAGGASNDWRNPMSPGGQNLVPQQQQQQMSYAQDLMAQQGLQHHQQQQLQQQMWPPANVAPQQSLAPGPVAQAPEQPAQAAEPAPEAQEAEVPKAANAANANAWGKVPTQAVENLSVQQEQAPVVEAAPTANESVAASEPVAAATPAKAAPVEKAAAAIASPAPVKLTKAEARKAAAAATAAAAAVVEPVERAAQPSPAPKAAAPWAKLEEEAAIPSPSLREIQQAEAVKAAAAAPKKAAPQQQSTEAAKSGSPTSTTTVSWGLNGSNAAKPAVAAPAPATSPAPAAVWQTSSATPSKTLKQIQEEEARQKARAAQLKAAQSANLGSAAAKAAYAGALSTAAAQSNAAAASAWSTVGSGGKPVAGAARPAPPAAQAAAAARPAAVAAAPKPSVITSIQSSNSMTRSSSVASAIDEATPSAEFLAWAKVALKSVTGVNLDEFLQMLLTFPLNPDPIVMEIISDSVYANSSTLDGRRFAQEFVSKRKADAKAQKAGTVAPAGKGSSLADIVKAQPKAAADAGFGAFKVVKKKGKKA